MCGQQWPGVAGTSAEVGVREDPRRPKHAPTTRGRSGYAGRGIFSLSFSMCFFPLERIMWLGILQLLELPDGTVLKSLCFLSIFLVSLISAPGLHYTKQKHNVKHTKAHANVCTMCVPCVPCVFSARTLPTTRLTKCKLRKLYVLIYMCFLLTYHLN